jgi:AAA ATPase central domain protein
LNNLKELLNFNNVALLGIITYILKSIKGYAFSIYNNIMQRFRKSITITDQIMIERALLYINKVCYSNISKELLADNILYTSESNCSLTFGGYLIRIGKFTWVSIVSSKTNENSYNSSQLRVTLSVTFYGLNRRKYIDDFKSALSIDTEAANTLYMLSLSGKYSINTSIKKNRNGKKVFGKAAELVGKLIDRFIDNKSLYEKYNKNYKLVILLYGPPGTGKSTMITNIALHLKSRYIYYIDALLKSDDDAGSICGSLSSNSYSASTIDNKPTLAIFVIEDIDRSVLSESHTDKNTKIHDTVNNLMQVLDSGITPSNSIFIITTNHIEKIPDQVKRVGRIDYTIYVGNLDREEAIAMCNHYEVDPDKYLDKDKTEFNPAELETKIFKDIDKILRGE